MSVANEAQLKIINTFVKDLEASFGVKQERVSFKDLWADAPPKAAGSASLEEYLDTVRTPHACK